MAVPSSTTSTSAEEPNKNNGSWLDTFFTSFSNKLYQFYYNLGVYIDGNASRVIYLTIFVTVIAGLGFMNYESESRAEKVCIYMCAYRYCSKVMLRNS